MMPKTMMERFLDEFLNDYTVEEVLEILDVDIYELLEQALASGLVDGHLVERLQGAETHVDE